MVFTIDPTGKPVPSNWVDIIQNAETPYPGDWQLTVTGVPVGTSPATVAASILSSPVALPLPFSRGSYRWTVAYGSLGGAITATPGA
jgi:hypothetical protein